MMLIYIHRPEKMKSLILSNHPPGCNPFDCTGVCDPYTGCDRCKNGTHLPDCERGKITRILTYCMSNSIFCHDIIDYITLGCVDDKYGENCEQTCSYSCKWIEGRACNIENGVCNG